MNDFEGKDSIYLYYRSVDDLYDKLLTYDFEITSDSSSGANDGKLGYNETVQDVTVKITTSTGTDVTDEILSDSSVSNNVITLELNYPVTTGAGRYIIHFALDLGSTETKLLTFPLLRAEVL